MPRQSLLMGILIGGVSMASVVAAPKIQVAGPAEPSPQSAATHDVPRTAPSGSDPVVLELFTSQGCSSCPPADQVLSRLGTDVTTRARVVPLAFHVDYWDRVGWTDPFGKAQWTQRQEAYNRIFRLESVYTPQLIVNGRAHLNGAQEKRILQEVAADQERPPDASIQLVTEIDESGARPELSVVVTAEMIEDVPARKLEAFVALFENDLVTPVSRGENDGRTLRNDFVVRRFEKALSIQPKAGSRGQRTLRFPIDRAWKLENLGVAAFLQDPSSMKISGATAQPLR